jgi:hypothetical protein
MGYAVFGHSEKYSNQIIAEIDQLLLASGSSLTIEQKKRVRFYTALITITTRLFSVLRGKGPTEKEKRLALLVGAITPFLDDLSDHRQVSLVELLVHRRKTLSEEELVAQFLFEQIKSLGSPDFISTCTTVMLAQDKSRRQLLDAILSEQELKSITFDKGGSSMLLYRLVLENPLRPGEARAIYLLGYLLQLVNDQFDVYKDYYDRQQTLYTQAKNFQKRQQVFLDLQSRVIRAFVHLGYNPKRMTRFLALLFTITSRGEVCAAQLADLHTKRGEIITIDSLSRKELVCDMEKLSNMRKSFGYALQANRLVTSFMKKIPAQE